MKMLKIIHKGEVLWYRLLGLFEPPFTNRKRRYRGYKIGDWTYGEPVILKWGQGELAIGKYCSIASGVKILVGGEHHPGWVSTYPFDVFMGVVGEAYISERTKGVVEIGNDVWIGTDALILSGVKIGSGVVIGAGSIVTRDMPDYAVVVGNPARVIRMRFEASQIEALLRIRWWDWPDKQVSQARAEFMQEGLNAFIAAYDPGQAINQVW